MKPLTIIQAVLFFVIAGVCIAMTFVEHVSALFFLGLGIAACTIVSLIDHARTSPDNGGFMFLTSTVATYINLGLFAVACVFMVLSMSGVITIA